MTNWLTTKVTIRIQRVELILLTTGGTLMAISALEQLIR
jgi:hypothetical protein